MKKQDETEKLGATISMLETIIAEEEAQLKTQFKESVERLQPMNLVKSALNKLSDQPEFKEDLLDVSISLVTGYFSKRLFFGSSKNPLKQALGNLMQLGVTTMISKHVEELRQFATFFMSDLFSKKEKEEQQEKED